MSKGYVYVLSNPSIPGLLKIGRSKNGGGKRAVDLYQTGVPTPFVLEFEVLVEDAHQAEILTHEALKENRVNTGREFFQVDITQAIEAILSICAGDIDCKIIDVDEHIYPDVVWEILGGAYENPGMGEYIDFFQAIRRIKPEHIKEAIEDHRRIREQSRKKFSRPVKVISNG